MAPRVTTICPKCKAKLAVGSENAGKRLRCPKCGSAVIVPQEDLIPPVPIFDFASPPVPDADDDFSDGDESDDDPYTNKPQTFRSRTANLAGDFREEIVQRNLIPPGVARLVADDEQFLFASNPSQTALVLRFIVNGIGSFFGNPFIYSIPVVNSTTVRIFLAIIALGWVLIVLYVTYIAWRTRFFAITSRRIIVRAGWFNHIILMAPVHNIQMVTINTGFIDRWLGLNSVCFETAAASGFGLLRSGVLVFSSIHSDEVMKAYSQALGRQTN